MDLIDLTKDIIFRAGREGYRVKKPTLLIMISEMQGESLVLNKRALFKEDLEIKDGCYYIKGLEKYGEYEEDYIPKEMGEEKVQNEKDVKIVEKTILKFKKVDYKELKEKEKSVLEKQDKEDQIISKDILKKDYVDHLIEDKMEDMLGKNINPKKRKRIKKIVRKMIEKKFR
jgi:hypothetical protein